MTSTFITNTDKEEILKYFGKPLEEMDAEEFRKILKAVRAKYHPDNFEKFEDETIREMATERFQAIQALADKVEAWYQGKIGTLERPSGDFNPGAQFAFDKMKIEVITSDKDLKYHLFGTQYRWLLYGDKFKIPGTKAHIVMDEDHRGVSIGFRETIRMYVTFGVDDAIEDIVMWLYNRIKDRGDSLIIEGNVIPIEPDAMMRHIRKTSYLEIGAG
ncbi:MAG TPA: hypothetical protein PKB07_04645 [Flavilitoribacter sp.]|nr:hypothetical protein [Flavilitoribacter sp.]